MPRGERGYDAIQGWTPVPLSFFLFLLDFSSRGIKLKPVRFGLFSVPAPLFDLLAGSSAGFFVLHDPRFHRWRFGLVLP
jgi:hypothetical protein